MQGEDGVAGDVWVGMVVGVVGSWSGQRVQSSEILKWQPLFVGFLPAEVSVCCRYVPLRALITQFKYFWKI